MIVAHLSNRPDRRGLTRLVVERDGQRAEAHLPPKEVAYLRLAATGAKLPPAARAAGVRLRHRLPQLFGECDGRGTPRFALLLGTRTTVPSAQRAN